VSARIAVSSKNQLGRAEQQDPSSLKVKEVMVNATRYISKLRVRRILSGRKKAGQKTKKPAKAVL